ncbi:MAG: helix-turn-helix domain-containing protein [Streptosporangiaceae bacterium]
MPNERLRAALLQHGMSATGLAEKLGVDHKTVERWVKGRIPYRRHRYAIAQQLGVDEVYLWPDALTRDQVAVASHSEIVAVYPHRSEVPRDVWGRLFSEAESEIGALVYSGLFLAEDSGVQRILAQKARAGVRVRILLGDPDSPEVAERGKDEGVGSAMEAKIRNALVLYRALREIDGADIRFHRTVLYNSIYRADDQLLVNTHLYGLPAAHAPVWHIRKVAGGELATAYLESFERVWEIAVPVGGS